MCSKVTQVTTREQLEQMLDEEIREREEREDRRYEIEALPPNWIEPVGESVAA